jgi:hypothetical protein
MLVTADTKQMKSILDMRGLRIVAVTIGTLTLVHPAMMAQSTIGTPLIMIQMTKGYRTELALARKNHDIRTITCESLSTNGNQKDSQRSKDNSFHANPVAKH